MPDPLPLQAWRVYVFLCGYVKANGFCPSYREVGEKLGLSAPTVCYHVAELEKRGYLKRQGRYRPRSLALLVPVEEAQWRQGRSKGRRGPISGSSQPPTATQP